VDKRHAALFEPDITARKIDPELVQQGEFLDQIFLSHFSIPFFQGLSRELITVGLRA
jgi:hypothetical protein